MRLRGFGLRLRKTGRGSGAAQPQPQPRCGWGRETESNTSAQDTANDASAARPPGKRLPTGSRVARPNCTGAGGPGVPVKQVMAREVFSRVPTN